jgi:hypothetical protein
MQRVHLVLVVGSNWAHSESGITSEVIRMVVILYFNEDITIVIFGLNLPSSEKRPGSVRYETVRSCGRHMQERQHCCHKSGRRVVKLCKAYPQITIVDINVQGVIRTEFDKACMRLIPEEPEE